MRQAEVAQQPPDRASVPSGPMRRGDPGGQFSDRQVPLLRDPAGDTVLQPGQFAIPAVIALALGCKTNGGQL